MTQKAKVNSVSVDCPDCGKENTVSRCEFDDEFELFCEYTKIQCEYCDTMFSFAIDIN